MTAKIMNPKFRSFLFLFALLLLYSCQKDQGEDNEPDESGTYTEGVFVTNEGPFQTGTGTISFYNRQSGEVIQDIFQKENSSQPLGNIVQSMNIIGERAYIVVNNANRVEVVDRASFISLASIEGFEQPRYLWDAGNGKAYVSQWGSTGMDGEIKVIDLASNQIEQSFVSGLGPENMTQLNDQLYVVNSGGFGTDNSVSVIDLNTNTLSKSIEVAKNPVGIVRDKNDALWVLSRGVTDWSDPENSEAGGLSKIANDEVELNLEMTDGAANLGINQQKDQLVYTLNAQVFKHGIEENALSNTSIIKGSFYSLAVDPKTDLIFASDAKDFQSKGEIFIYGFDGVVRDSFEAGIIPGGFIFN